jgi:hypothetical protein
MTAITVTVQRVGKFDQYIAGMKERAKKALMNGATMVQKSAQTNMSAGLQKFANSITVKGPTETAEGFSVEIGSFAGGKTTAILAAHELGSGLHGPNTTKYPIRAKNKPQLVFLWPNPPWGYVHPKIRQIQMPGGPLVFLNSVMHPGVKAQHFLLRAVRENDEKLVAAFLEAVKP